MENASFSFDENFSDRPRCNHMHPVDSTQWDQELYGQTDGHIQHPGTYWKILSKSRWSLPFVVTEDAKASNGIRKCGSVNLVNENISQSYFCPKDELDVSGDTSCGMNDSNANPWSHEFGEKHKRFGQLHYSWLAKKKQLIINWILVYPCIAFGVWAIIYILFGEQEAFIGGSLFSLLILEILAIACGELVSLILLPPAVGMLAAGLILRNVPPIAIAKDLTSGISSPLRAMSVVVLLTRGALSVDPVLIRKHWKVVPQLAVISCIVEAIIAAAAIYFIIQFPLEWSALMGCIISAMSGAIVVPLLSSVEQGLNLNDETKNVMVVAKVACGLDAILAICMAEFALGFIFAKGEIYEGLRKGVLEVIMGGAFGALWGGVVGLLLGVHHSNAIRTFAVFTGGCMSLLGLTKIGYPRGGPLGVFSGSLIVACLWRWKKVDGKNNDELQKTLTGLWVFFQPLLFGIIGARTDFEAVDWAILCKGILCLSISLLARTIATFAMTSCVQLTWRQRIFIAFAWIPKGTVQAALGPVALDTAKELNFGLETEEWGYKVMNFAVLVIILASSLGSCFLLFFGRTLMKK